MWLIPLKRALGLIISPIVALVPDDGWMTALT